MTGRTEKEDNIRKIVTSFFLTLVFYQTIIDFHVLPETLVLLYKS